MLASIVVGLVFGFAPPCAAQHKDPHVNCPYCNHVGFKVCKKHSKKQIAKFEESGAIFSSLLATCKECGGTLMVDCDKCDNVAVQDRIARRAKEIHDWLAERRKTVDKLIQHEVKHCESRWFRLTFDLKPMTVGRRKLPSWELMYLYLKRFEEHRKYYKEVMQLTDTELPDKCDIYMWRDGRDQANAALKFTGMGSSGAGVKLMGISSVYTMHMQKRYITNDASLHRHMVHNITHLLTSQMSPANWIGKLKAGWLDAGLAHYFEFKLDKKCTTYCYQEVATNRNFKGGKWLVPIRRMVAAGTRLPAFAAVATKNTDQLMPKEHALSFSYVHFLLEGDFENDKVKEAGGRGKALCQVVRAFKAKKPVRKALGGAYGWNALSFEEKWKEWVLRTYPVR